MFIPAFFLDLMNASKIFGVSAELYGLIVFANYLAASMAWSPVISRALRHSLTTDTKDSLPQSLFASPNSKSWALVKDPELVCLRKSSAFCLAKSLAAPRSLNCFKRRPPR